MGKILLVIMSTLVAISEGSRGCNRKYGRGQEDPSSGAGENAVSENVTSSGPLLIEEIFIDKRIVKMHNYIISSGKKREE